MGCVDRSRYVEDVRAVTGERTPGNDHWQQVQDLCSSRLGSLGFQVERQQYGTGVNVIGRRAGTARPEERIVLTAHYDHIAGCDGADDNATGIAALLETARVLALGSHRRSLELFCADEEETGHLGARAYVASARASGQEITMAFVYDSIGYVSREPGSQEFPGALALLFPDLWDEYEENQRRGDFIMVLADESARVPAQAVASYTEALGWRSGLMELSDELKMDPLLYQLRRADHESFWQADVPALLVNDTSELRYSCYHCGSCPDVVENLDHDFAIAVVRSVVGATVAQLNSP